MKEITEYAIGVHQRALAKVSVVLHMSQTIVAHHSLLPVVVYVQDAGRKDHQIDDQQQEA